MHTKILRFSLVVMLVFALILSSVSCINSNGNGDPSQNIDTANLLPITKNGKAAITVVSSYSKSSEYAKEFNSFLSYFKDSGISFKLSYEASEDQELPEILIGDRINATGEYYVDPHSLGDEGYVVKVVGNKLIVAGGSDESLIKAIRFLSHDIMNLDDSKTDIQNIGVSRSTSLYHRQNYPIKSITVGGNDLAGYEIVIADLYDKDLMYCAEKLHSVLYNYSGYWLGSSIKTSRTGPSIRISVTDDSKDGGFRVFVDGEDLVIACAYPALLTSTFDTFLDEFIINTDKSELSLSGEVYTGDIGVIKYSDFGAVGDGVVDDYEAIKKTHEFANISGITVVAENGKTYNLGQHSSPIIIKTNTVWSGATFIVDDSHVAARSSISLSAVFSIEPNNRANAVHGIKSLSKGQTNVGVSFKSPTLLYIVYDGIKQYIRYGNNADGGASQQEIILVDENGNVDPSTPILWDYPSLTSVTAYSASEKPITIHGGTFITVANQAPREYTYYARNISISRSNVTLDGLLHLIEGEGDTGAPYNGFISIKNCNNILVQNTVLTGHKVYKLSSDSSNSMGTYDITVSVANNVTFKNSSQTNSITDNKYWGIMGSNYCKNLTYDGCTFSRFDAHKGTHNATIINSEIGHQKISIIGSGTLRVENTVVHGNNIVNLRNDYGSTWDGDMIFKNVTLKNTGTATLINATWYNHYFGYTCYLPKNIIIDGITLSRGTSFYVLPKLKNGINTDTVDGGKNKNKIVLTETVSVVSNPNRYSYSISSNTTLYRDVELKED